MSLHARIHVGAGDVIGEKVLTDDHTSYKRPYQCDLCHKSYSTAKHRWGHVSTTHRCVLIFNCYSYNYKTYIKKSIRIILGKNQHGVLNRKRKTLV